MKRNGQDKFATNKNSKVRIKVVKNKCISAAICLIRAPKTFKLDEDDIAYVTEGEWDDVTDIIDAAKSCPTQAIIVEDLDGKQIYPNQ